MALHDSIFDSLSFDAERVLTLRFSELPDRPATEKLVIRISRFQAVMILGVLERDWFLSGVHCYAGDGTALDPRRLQDQEIARLIVLGTDGSSIEVMSGRATSSIEKA